MAPSTDIIQRAGGDAAVATACGVSLDALRKWREMGRVPSKHWGKMASLADASLDDVAKATLVAKREAKVEAKPARPKRRRNGEDRARAA